MEYELTKTDLGPFNSLELAKHMLLRVNKFTIDYVICSTYNQRYT